MADLRYTVDVDTRGAQQSIGSLKSTLGGIAAAVAAAFSFRDQVESRLLFVLRVRFTRKPLVSATMTSRAEDRLPCDVSVRPPVVAHSVTHSESPLRDVRVLDKVIFFSFRIWPVGTHFLSAAAGIHGQRWRCWLAAASSAGGSGGDSDKKKGISF